MAYVYVLNGRSRYAVFRLTKDVTTFGQRDDADVVLKDPWISWTHARIVREGTGFTIEDLGSTNGTYVDCARVKRRALEEDSLIFLGRTHLLFVESDRVPSAPPPRARPAESAGSGGAAPEHPGATTDRLRLRPATQVFAAPHEREGGGASSEDAFEFRGPLEDYGRIEELDDVAREPDTDGFLAPPPVVDEAGRPLEIDVGDLLDSTGQPLAPAAESSTGAEEEDAEAGFAAEMEAEAAALLDEASPIAPPSSGEIDPIALRDAEIERLRAALAARDAEIRRLREEVRKLKEKYLDS